jgi:hypothetical protein
VEENFRGKLFETLKIIEGWKEGRNEKRTVCERKKVGGGKEIFATNKQVLLWEALS